MYSPQTLGGEKPKDSLAGQFIGHGGGLLGGGRHQPGVGQHSLDGQSVHRVVLQQPGNQIFGSSADIGLCGISILHLDDRWRRENQYNDEEVKIAILRNCSADLQMPVEGKR